MLTQIQTQRQQLKILPQQIQMLNIFHLNVLELDQRISDELDENPLLEQNNEEENIDVEKFSKEAVQDFQDWEEHGYDDIPNYKLEYENYFNNDAVPNIPIKAYTDFRETLKNQIRYANLSDRQLQLADYIIDCLNGNGLLAQDLDNMADDLSFKQGMIVEVAELEVVLKEVQRLEPVGIGAQNTRECLLLQLYHFDKKGPDVKKAITLLENHYSDLSHRNMEKIMDALDIEEDELKIILKLLASLKMKPISEAEGSQPVNNNILPDFILTVNDNEEIEINLFRSRSSSLYINQSLMETVDSANQRKDKTAAQYLKSKLSSAQWFVNAIKQRESTMMQIMKAIVQLQREYFLYGDVSLLKPMILKNIADRVGVDISTVSRVTSNKYVDTPFGIILLKNLFTEGIINQEGEVISNRVIQSAIEAVIEKEDKLNPYTDQQLVAILASKGINVARRTIAKYREQLQIPVAQLRRMWA
ncbi:RNA polymerase factor sigma-54 [Segetibacter sp. 3557_3]|uniref:RNA polymerase factor sigma-54 n=1 Tax=Segetibacter sp. 3557_3 TaxID=2547429 RepID=UPI0010587831|nr:RNA polymerase factor sigma-54 [Segetibacter sp. 3557_3]TDH26207.1 RNA polymerase factor sigma-54 [Segetibacter sp. 3557_3]